MNKWVLVCILVFAAFLRLYKINSVPPSPSLDEVSIGYNAYSLTNTGKDEYGSVFPVLLRAYDDYRPALYVYVVVPFIKLLGVESVSVRLPSVILSIITVYVTYLIGVSFGKIPLGIVSALLLAISPWHIYISRLGHEVNLGLTLLVLGIYLFLKNKFLWAAIVFGLSLHGYQSEKIIVPVLLVSLACMYWRDLFEQKRKLIVPILVFLIIIYPAVTSTFSEQGMSRFRGTSAISSQTSKIEAVQTVLTNYISHFSPVWLFSGRDREAHKVPGLGLLYVWELPFLLLGFWKLLQRKTPNRLRLFLLVWLFTAPLPAAITTQAPHAMRSFTMVPVLQIIEALGLVSFVVYSWKFLVGLVIISIGIFWQGYFVRFPLEQSDSFQYATGEAMRYAIENKINYASIQFSNQGNLYQSYMFFLFYAKIDPKNYLALGGTTSGGFAESHFFDTYAFGILPQENLNSNTLYFYDSSVLPKNARVVQTFYNLDNKPAIYAVTKN